MNLILFVFKAICSPLGIFTFIMSYDSLSYLLRLVRQGLFSQTLPWLREVKWFAQDHTTDVRRSEDPSGPGVIRANLYVTLSRNQHTRSLIASCLKPFSVTSWLVSVNIFFSVINLIKLWNINFKKLWNIFFCLDHLLSTLTMDCKIANQK